MQGGAVLAEQFIALQVRAIDDPPHVKRQADRIPFARGQRLLLASEYPAPRSADPDAEAPEYPWRLHVRGRRAKTPHLQHVLTGPRDRKRYLRDRGVEDPTRVVREQVFAVERRGRALSQFHGDRATLRLGILGRNVKTPFDLERDGTVALGHVPGPVWLVTFGGTAPFLSDDAVETLVRFTKEIALEGGIWPRFQPGQEVTVRWGGSEIWGRILEENRSPRARVRILLDFVGTQVGVQVPGDRVSLMTTRRPPRRTRGRGRFIGGGAAPLYAGAAPA